MAPLSQAWVDCTNVKNLSSSSSSLDRSFRAAVSSFDRPCHSLHVCERRNSSAQSFGDGFLGDDRYFALHVHGYDSSPYPPCSYRDVRAPLVWLNLAESQVPVMDGFGAMGGVLDLRKLHCVCAASGLNQGESVFFWRAI